MPDDSRSPCPVCEGRGWYYLDVGPECLDADRPPAVVCAECAGRGWFPRKAKPEPAAAGPSR